MLVFCVTSILRDYHEQLQSVSRQRQALTRYRKTAYDSVFQPVRRYAQVRMRNLVERMTNTMWMTGGVRMKNLVVCYKHILNSLSLLNHPIVFS